MEHQRTERSKEWKMVENKNGNEEMVLARSIEARLRTSVKVAAAMLKHEANDRKKLHSSLYRNTTKHIGNKHLQVKPTFTKDCSSRRC